MRWIMCPSLCNNYYSCTNASGSHLHLEPIRRHILLDSCQMHRHGFGRGQSRPCGQMVSVVIEQNLICSLVIDTFPIGYKFTDAHVHVVSLERLVPVLLVPFSVRKVRLQSSSCMHPPSEVLSKVRSHHDKFDVMDPLAGVCEEYKLYPSSCVMYIICEILHVGQFHNTIGEQVDSHEIMRLNDHASGSFQGTSIIRNAHWLRSIKPPIKSLNVSPHFKYSVVRYPHTH